MLLGGFTLVSGTEEIGLPMSAQRLVAFLALRDRPLSRVYAASVLWPDCPAHRSLADLRTALWRANRSAVPVIACAGIRLRLRSEVQVDVRELIEFGRVTVGMAKGVVHGLGPMSWPDLSLDLLPDWCDDWLIDDREGVRQLRLHALERLTEELSLSGRHAEAIQAGIAAVRLEPLRETAHATLIRAHLAEGNRSEALRQFHRCRRLLAEELGVEPSASIGGLLAQSAFRDPRLLVRPPTAPPAAAPNLISPRVTG
jgi:DNA-binding SARP family transcriptional activator